MHRPNNAVQKSQRNFLEPVTRAADATNPSAARQEEIKRTRDGMFRPMLVEFTTFSF
jgi:hypothetical protein